MENKNKPSKSYSLGVLNLAVFENEHEGKKFKSYKITRSYKKKGSENWDYTENMRFEDLANLSVLLQRVVISEKFKIKEKKD